MYLYMRVTHDDKKLYFCVLQSSFKETYMYDFFKSFQEDKCIEKVKKVIFGILSQHRGECLSIRFSRHFIHCALFSFPQFLDEISSNVSKESSGLEDAVVLKEG